MIKVAHLCKDYRVAKRGSGFKKVIKATFHREYQVIHALQDVSFEIPDGEIVGYIGPNGAGKSSTIKIMSGILTPDSGICEINGMVPWVDRKKYVKNIGVVFGQRSQLWWDVPVEDTFELLKDIYQIDANVYHKNKKELCEMLAIGELLKTPARQLSLGQRMRCEIGASLLHDPKILFLDEPTIGLDAVSKLAVRKVIGEINREKKTTVILTTHDMQDVETLTDRVLLIGKGRVLLDGTMQEWKQKTKDRQRMEILYRNTECNPTQIREKIEDMCPVIVEKSDLGKVEISFDPVTASTSEIVGKLCQLLEITDMKTMYQDADELIVSLYQKYKI